MKVNTVCSFSACSSNMYGNNCSETCNCMAGHTNNADQTCDTVTGTCDCQSGWNGSRCENDINECRINTDGCEDHPNQNCVNTDGLFFCDCYLDYSRDVSGNCIESRWNN